MNEIRIIKSSVRSAIEDVVRKNKQHDPYDQSTLTATGRRKRWMYPIIIPGGKQLVIEVMGDRVLTDMTTLPEECYDALLSRGEVYTVIDRERSLQDGKWGVNHPQSLPGFLILMRRELQEAEAAWVNHVMGDHAPLNEIIRVAATAVACLEKYGVTGSTVATNDIPET